MGVWKTDVWHRKVNKYWQRSNKHLMDLEKHMREGELIQASEKAWGAISALINTFYVHYHKKEVRKVRDKEKAFEEICRRYPSLRNMLITEETTERKFMRKLYGLHEYFYGGRYILSNEQIFRSLKLSKPILSELKQKISEDIFRS